MSRRVALGALGVAALLVAPSVVAHVRLTNSSNGSPLFWDTPSAISIVLNSDGSDDIEDGSHVVALRNAIDAWNAAPGSVMNMVEDTDPAQMARTDWDSGDIHLLLFDEVNSSGYFPNGSGIVAVTPVFFFSNGRIADADILFNGKTFRFTTDGTAGRFDVQDVATHELGHLLGLDHSGWAGASMYPYVDTSVILHRSLAEDDVRGMQDAYPQGTFATILGTVTRVSGGSTVSGAHVVALDSNGRTAAGALGASDGSFVLRGLPAGTYDVYASPLEAPVSSANLGITYAIDTDFSSTVLGTMAVTAGGSGDLGTVTVDDDTALHLGHSADDYPLRITRGQTSNLSVRGNGLVLGSTLVASDPDIGVTVTNWLGTVAQIQVTVPSNESAGHVDLTVTNAGGERSTLTAGLEVTAPDPVVSAISPSSGGAAGGASITIFGANFEAGARAVIGDRIYADGEVGGCTVVDSGTITLTTGVTLGGLHDVIVIDSSGVEGRLLDGFLVASMPAIATTFPSAGFSSGGTEVILTGTGFASGASVSIDSVAQTDVTFEGSTRIRVSTLAGSVGGPYEVVLTNPGGGEATSAFTYVSQPDPIATTFTPAMGSAGGGDELTLFGSNFTNQTTVIFGADPYTGQGGMPAQDITFVDSSTLTMTTPAHPSGTETVLVRENSTLQGSIVPAMFTFEGGGSSSGGGCAAISPGSGPPTIQQALANAWWILMLFGLLTMRTRYSARHVRRAEAQHDRI